MFPIGPRPAHWRPAPPGAVLLAGILVALCGCDSGGSPGTGLVNPPVAVAGDWSLSVGCPEGYLCPDVLVAPRRMEIEAVGGSLVLIEVDCDRVSLGGGTGALERSVLTFSLACRTVNSGECNIERCESGVATWDGSVFSGELTTAYRVTGPAGVCAPDEGVSRALFTLTRGWPGCPTFEPVAAIRPFR